MTTEMWLIAAVRLLSALPVLRWPFYGALFAIAVDQSDLFIMNLVDLGGVTDYQTFDKYLDQAYLVAFLAVALTRWRGYERSVSAGLYAYRLAGFVAFELTEARSVLLLFPNFFEPWFVTIAARHEFHLEQRLAGRRFVWACVALAVLKLTQEFVVHYLKLLDGFTAVEAVEAIWDFITP
jgi:hypothetical protein